MKLNVNPNRMELLRLRRRLALAERGHKLLKDKLEEIMRRFLDTIRKLTVLQEEVSTGLDKIFLSFALARGGGSMEELEALLPEGKLELAVERSRALNLSIPGFKVATLDVSSYDLLGTEAELDIGIKKTEKLLPSMLEMARLWKSLELLSHEIEVTRRRVNALEHILIPSIREAIHSIAARLGEMERSYQVQLMRVKEIVRRH
ncbi:MAG: V-type ATP synthase subunit D [Candidatus Aminicenantales bacterium]